MDENWGTVITVVAAFGSFLLGWMGRAREVRKEDKTEAAAAATTAADIKYIKEGVDDIRQEMRKQGDDLRADMRKQGDQIDLLRERVVAVEQSAKSAHHRLDELADKI